MNTITTVFIAFGLAADAFAVSITSGMKIKRLKINDALKIATFFGGFQAVMPLIGWVLGISLRGLISDIDHWIAFGLLSFIGGRMIYESLKVEPSAKPFNPLHIYILLSLSVATSVDALVVGLSFAVLKQSIYTLVIMIGSITFLLAVLGCFIGSKFGKFFNNKIEAIGGIILIGIGVKILVEHLAYL